ncbi:MAG: DUF2971 domain-containing protein [Corynebacterium sp.]|uniref:DUF2971 domain-containing protein n=1 Tax=Corynebacterium sp. TaxID=1720 RepID=UPI003F0488A6
MLAVAEENLLWHYTDINGLLGIFPDEHGGQGELSFHGSSVYTMNDYKEVEFGLSLFESALKDEFDFDSTDQVNVDSRLYQSYVEGILWQISKWDQLNVFSVSFSRAKDQLSQWRGYADAGYSIGMDHEQLKNGIELGEGAAGRRSKFGEVIYFDADPEQNILYIKNSDSFKYIVAMIRREAPIEQILEHIYWTIMMDIPFWKSAGFSEEQEVRFVVAANGLIKYKPSRLGPRAYMVHTVPLEAVREVMVGPGHDEDARFTTTHRFVQEKTLGRVYATSSGVTFRG